MALARCEFDATDAAGIILTNVSVEVRRESDNALVSVYSDRAGVTPLGNPFTVADGKVAFHAAGAAYKITMTSGAYSRTVRYKPVGLAQELDYSSIGAGLLNAADEAAARTVISVREKLTANRTYYVRTDGSNSNNGLANTSGGAFLTLQKAWDTVAALDLSIYTVTIKVADGTYTAGINATSMPLGGAGIVIEGNTSTPANVHLNMATHCIRFRAALPCPMTIQGFKLTFAGASASGVFIAAPGAITVLNMELAGGSTGFCGAYRADGGGASITVSTGQTISGSMSCFVQAAAGGFVQFFGITVTLTGTPAWSWQGFIANSMGIISVAGVTFSGSATGKRYEVQTNSLINTGGGGASYLPGNAAGTASGDGQYV